MYLYFCTILFVIILTDTRPTNIIHMETLHKDIRCYLKNNSDNNANKIKKNIDIDESDLEKFYHVNQSPGGHSSQEKIRHKYFGQLSKNVMKNFFDRYKEDFILHGYKIESFFPYASDFDDEGVVENDRRK